ncbi:MAG: VWA domain-containing protein [Alphaproteobacteria bacterium]|nr:VWA domain-containing protein [Alphaproteobacteria bacterium]
MATATHQNKTTPLTGRIVGFIDHLRINGYKVGTQESRIVVEHLGRRPPAALSHIRQELKILLACGKEEWQNFDDLFEAYWQTSGRRRDMAQKTASPDIRKPPKQTPIWQNHFDDGTSGSGKDTPQIETEAGKDVSGEATGRLVAANTSVLQKTDLKNIVDPDEIRAAEALALRLASAMRYRLSRRHQPSRHGSRIDLRRTIRAALPCGGEPIDLYRRCVPHRPVHILLFLDVSGSMKHYSRFFLQFAKGMVCSWIHTDAYIFHTRLIRVTDAVRDKNSARAMTRLALMAEGFGGGTRLGDSLATFNRHYAKRAVNSRTVAIIVSDGYDTGTPENLASELARMKKRVRKLVWLNPLLGWQNYQPVTAAMQAAQPHIDHFAAANTLESVAQLEPHLAAM